MMLHSPASLLLPSEGTEENIPEESDEFEAPSSRWSFYEILQGFLTFSSSCFKAMFGAHQSLFVAADFSF